MEEKKVYVIDDDPDVSNSTRELVQSVGLQCAVFTNALDILEYYQLDFQSCIVSDVRLPKMNGFAMLE